MKSNKLSLTELKVNSFITNENAEKLNTVKGGTAGMKVVVTVGTATMVAVSGNCTVVNATTVNQTLNQTTNYTYTNNNTNTIVIQSCFCNTQVGC